MPVQPPLEYPEEKSLDKEQMAIYSAVSTWIQFSIVARTKKNHCHLILRPIDQLPEQVLGCKKFLA